MADDFGVKYVGKQYAEHLINVLKDNYEVDIDWEGTRYIGLTIERVTQGTSINARLHCQDIS